MKAVFLSAGIEVDVSFIKRILLLIALFGFSISNGFAALTIEITEGVESAVPLAIVPFASQSAPVNISSIVNADLERSGYFKMMAESGMPSRPSSSA